MELKKHKLPSDFYLSELVTTLNIQKPVLFTQGIWVLLYTNNFEKIYCSQVHAGYLK